MYNLQPFIFPAGFHWGTATASLQVEGSLDADGAGNSSWMAFASLSGRVRNNDTPGLGCDHYRRWREDLKLMRELGVTAYRFSVSWPRLFPAGDGPVNTPGGDFYDMLIDALLEAGIEPFMTVYHWETPEIVERDWGGWRNIRTAAALGDFGGYLARRYSDRVRHFITVNEIPCFTGYCYGEEALHPPALKECDAATLERVIFNGVLGHAYVTSGLRANARQPLEIGFSDNPHGFVPASGSPDDIAAARQAMRFENSRVGTLIMEGAFPDDCPVECDAGELALIRSARPDFYGVNAYSARHVAAAPECPHGYRLLDYPADYPRLDMPWLQLEPSGIYWSIRFINELWKPKAIYVTENGCACGNDLRDASGRVLDTARIMYTREHLAWIWRACAEGHPLKGYFHWTLLDNFEWRHGYSKRFGMVEILAESLERRPKLSFEFYKGVIQHNGVI